MVNRLEWNDFMRWLNRLLAGYIYKSGDIRAMAMSFGFPVLSVNFDNNPKVNWTTILDFYIKNHPAEEAKLKIQAYIREVIQLFGETPDLKKALAWQSPKGAERELKATEYDDKVGDTKNLEKIMRLESTLLPSWFLEVGFRRGKSVGCIDTSEELGTGFLLKNNYILTNNHVIPSTETAKKAIIKFNYEQTANGSLKKIEEYTFDLSQSDYFATSAEHDWTIIKLQGNANKNWGWIEIKPIELRVKERVSIIQHPMGEPKQIGIHNNLLTHISEDSILYLTDTLPGSSGSPVFNTHWDLVGLHNRGGYLREPETTRTLWRNGGININKVLAGIRAANIPGF